MAVFPSIWPWPLFLELAHPKYWGLWWWIPSSKHCCSPFVFTKHTSVHTRLPQYSRFFRSAEDTRKSPMMSEFLFKGLSHAPWVPSPLYLTRRLLCGVTLKFFWYFLPFPHCDLRVPHEFSLSLFPSFILRCSPRPAANSVFPPADLLSASLSFFCFPLGLEPPPLSPTSGPTVGLSPLCLVLQHKPNKNM